MPIAPAAKGLIIVSGLIVAASIALYENEQVREWVETTGRRISGVWDDIVNFDQRQRQRRAQPQGYPMGQRQNPDSNSAQERRDVRRRTNEATEQRKEPGASETEVNATTASREITDAEGLRRRKARGDESQEHLLGQGQVQEAADPAEVLLDQVEDPAISVPELLPEDTQLEDVKDTSDSRSLQSSSFFSTKASQEDLSESKDSLLEYEMPEVPSQNASSILGQQTEQHETAQPSPIHTSDPSTTTVPITSPLPTAATNLTLEIPTSNNLTTRSRAQSTSTLSPVMVHTPTSASSISADEPHTPLHDDDFEALSDAGTETASHVSEWREEGDEDMVSVASEESGWSDIGGSEGERM